MGRGVVLKFRTFPDGGRGVVCESSDVSSIYMRAVYEEFRKSGNNWKKLGTYLLNRI